MDLLQLKRVAHFFGWGAETPKADKPVKIGLLGASQVGNYALVWPAKRVAKAEVVAVAARDSKRALDYARQHGIPRYYGSYDQLLADPEVDAVYVGLPNGLHGHWTRKALKAGKHVLCEKPFAANQHEVREVQALARSKGLLCREAFHYREHPMAARLRELVLGESSSDSGLPVWLQPPALPGGQGGTLGTLTSIDVKLLIPHWVFGGHNIRFQDQLAGGAMMDAGCYCASMLRLLSGAEPQVASATAELFNGSKITDGAMRARVSWPTLPGLQGTLHASLKHDGWVPETEVTVTGTKGTLHCTGFVMPFFGHTIRLTRTVPSLQSSPSPESTLISQPFSQEALQLPTASLSMSTQPAPKFQRTNTAMSMSSQQQGGAAALLAPSGLGIEPMVMEALEEWVEHAYGTEQETTYYHQLERFATDLHVLKGCSKAKSLAAVQAACAGDQSDALANQALVDAVYEAAGLPVRMPTKVPGLPAP